MKKVSFEEVGAVTATFLVRGALTAGDAVAMSGNGEVKRCGDGERICGVAVSVSGDGLAAVQVRGAVAVACGTAGVAPGWETLTGDGSGGVKTAGSGDTGGMALVLECGGGEAVVLL